MLERLSTTLCGATLALFLLFALRVPAFADDQTTPGNIETDAADLSDIFAGWAGVAAQARATQPDWSSPIATTTGMLEQRLRFDISREHSGNGTSTTLLDGGKGLDLIVSDSDEIQIAADPYDIRNSRTGKGALGGFNDWPFLRVEHRLASSPAGQDDYVLTAWLSVQAPSGITRLTSNAWTWGPTIAFGKGWDNFDVQGTVGASVPASHTAKLGDQIQTNVALQYHVLKVLWPEVEVNSTYYADGQRGGLNQVYLTPGVVIGRFPLGHALMFTFGAGYQVAVSPHYRASPLTPAYDHSLVLTTRLNF